MDHSGVSVFVYQVSVNKVQRTLPPCYPPAPAAAPARHLAAAHRLGPERLDGARPPRLGHADDRRQPHLVIGVPERLHPRGVPARGNGRAGAGRAHQRRGIPALAGPAQQPAAIGPLRGPRRAGGVRADGAPGLAGASPASSSSGRCRHEHPRDHRLPCPARPAVHRLGRRCLGGRRPGGHRLARRRPVGRPDGRPVPHLHHHGIRASARASPPTRRPHRRIPRPSPGRLRGPGGRSRCGSPTRSAVTSPNCSPSPCPSSALVTPLLFSAPARPAPSGFRHRRRRGVDRHLRAGRVGGRSRSCPAPALT